VVTRNRPMRVIEQETGVRQILRWATVLQKSLNSKPSIPIRGHSFVVQPSSFSEASRRKILAGLLIPG